MNNPSVTGAFEKATTAAADRRDLCGLSIVIPCHNERDNLQPLCRAIREAVEPLSTPYEIVFVDDGSTDDSWQVLQQLHRDDARIKAFRFHQNSGQSAALCAGLLAARGRHCVTLDADMQNHPRDIPKLVEKLADADCVCGSRVEARHQGDSLLKIISSRIANRVRNKLSDETISDAGCCYRAFRRECLSHIRFFNGAHRFLPTLLKMEGFRVVEVPVTHSPRHAGRSHYGVWNRLFKSFADLLAIRWMKKRLIRYEISESLN